MTAQSQQPFLKVADLKKHIPVGGVLSRRTLKAVDGVSFQIAKGETLGLVGESGCGKSTLGRMVAQLIPATEGRITLGGTPLSEISERELRKSRRRIQFIFQDPFASLDPRMRVKSIIEEPLRNFGVGDNAVEREALVHKTMLMCGLPPSFASRFPHQLSGGQRQRVGIARALVIGPELVIADEPVSALDVSIQAQILNLFAELRETLGLTLLFISHDLAAVRHISDRIAVMYLGKLVEVGPAGDLCTAPLHPYTAVLLSASPISDPAVEKARRAIPIRGEVPSPVAPPSGCRFHTRCPVAQFPRCSAEEPLLRDIGGRQVACHFPGSLQPAHNASATDEGHS